MSGDLLRAFRRINPRHPVENLFHSVLELTDAYRGLYGGTGAVLTVHMPFLCDPAAVQRRVQEGRTSFLT
jgi:hypothetical protein